MNHPGTLPLAPTKDGGKEGADLPTVTDSRLWADPYDNALSDSTSAKGDTSSSSSGGNLTLGKPEVPESDLDDLASQQICIMPVVVRGDANSAEAHEMRTRFRIAVVSGLGADGYTADDPSHLMWVRINVLGSKPELVPVEWYLRGGLSRRRSPFYGAILVVWLRDSVLNLYPLEQLKGIRTQLEDQMADLCLTEIHCPAFKVIGPYWSGTLIDILNDDLTAGRGMTLYSSSATMADGLLDLFAPKKAKGGPTGRERLRDSKAGPRLINLTCTDEELSESMIGELKLRGVAPGDPNSRIAIISDWDTEYGRVLPLTFAAKYRQVADSLIAGGKAPGRLPASAYKQLNVDDAHSWPPQILKSFYLSGVEGTLKSDDNQGEKPSDESKTAPGSNSSVVVLQRAEGEHQIDYISRLGKILSQRIDERNVGVGEHGRLDAIGVLGADVYDKLLLIQALRPIFKDAIFFTDTLDARFMDPVKSIPYTRNLVISSSYGFDLFRNFQVGVSPFRSTEQTGAFLAVQAAAAAPKEEVYFGHLTRQLKPLRFEIGRTYPVSLDIPGVSRPWDDKSDLTGFVDKFNGLLHPPQEDYFPDWSRIKALYLNSVLLSVICILLLFGAVRFVDGGHIPLSAWKERRTWAIALASIAFLELIIEVSCFYDGVEPATWIQGVSLWPSEFVRTLAFVVGFVGLLYCHSRVRKARERLAKEFGVRRPRDYRHRKKGLLRRYWRAISMPPQPETQYVLSVATAARRYKWLPAGLPPPKTPEPEKFVILEALWADACERSSAFGRNARTATLTLLFIAALFCLFFAMDHPVAIPYRDDFSHRCDVIVVFLASLMLVYLMFWVVDETHICLRFIKKLGRKEPTIWPQEAYRLIPSLTPQLSALGISENAASSYLDVCFIGKLSREAVPLIILPFIVLTLLIIARWGFFANWHWELLVLAVFGIDSAICIYCAVKLRLNAVDAKERAIRQISRAASEERAAKNAKRADALDTLKELMEKNMEGAFVPWHQQPFVSALLIPFGGSGGLGLIEYFLSRQ